MLRTVVDFRQSGTGTQWESGVPGGVRVLIDLPNELWRRISGKVVVDKQIWNMGDHSLQQEFRK